MIRRGSRSIWEERLGDDERRVLDPGAGALDEGDGRARRPDVLVVGGGVVGLLAAVSCRRAGLGRVLVVDAGRLAGGATAGAAGLLSPDLHAPLFSTRGESPAFLALARSSLRRYAELDLEWDGALGLRWGPRLVVPRPGKDGALGAPPGAERLDAARIAELEPSLAPIPSAYLVRDQAQVNPLTLAVALARRAGTVVSGVKIADLDVTGDRVVRVRTTAGDVWPGAVVIATGQAPAPWVRAPQRLVKGHLLVTQPGPFSLRHGVHTPAAGVEPSAGGGLLAGGTRDEGDDSSQVRPDVVERIRRDVAWLVPAAAGVAVHATWCCFRPATADAHPLIDRLPGAGNGWVAAGFDGVGILMAAATGAALAAWIGEGRQPPEVATFGLGRFA